MHEATESLGELEGLDEPVSPWLEIGVAQRCEPGVRGIETAALLEKAECHDERDEWMRERRVAPVGDPEVVSVHERVRVVEVVVLDSCGKTVTGELLAQRLETRCVVAQSRSLVRFERQLGRGELVVELGPTGKRPVWDRARNARVALELGVSREKPPPELRRVAEPPEGRAGVRGQEPASRGVAREDAGQQVRTVARERGDELRLEAVTLGAGLEPDRAVGGRDPPGGRPGAVTDDDRRPGRPAVGRDPLLDAWHAASIGQPRSPGSTSRP